MELAMQHGAEQLIARSITRRADHLGAAADRAEGVWDWLHALDDGDVELTAEERDALVAFLRGGTSAAARLILVLDSIGKSLERRLQPV